MTLLLGKKKNNTDAQAMMLALGPMMMLAPSQARFSAQRFQSCCLKGKVEATQWQVVDEENFCGLRHLRRLSGLSGEKK